MNEISNMNELRPFTLWAANAIEKTLKLKDELQYPAWESLTHAQRYIAMGEEFEEVQEAISGVLIEEKRTPDAIAHLQAELCDLAITAFMLSGGFDEKISSLKRGRIDNE